MDNLLSHLKEDSLFAQADNGLAVFGNCLFQFLWCFIIDDLLRYLEEESLFAQAYAD